MYHQDMQLTGIHTKTTSRNSFICQFSHKSSEQQIFRSCLDNNNNSLKCRQYTRQISLNTFTFFWALLNQYGSILYYSCVFKCEINRTLKLYDVIIGYLIGQW